MTDSWKWIVMFILTLLGVIVPIVIYGISKENKCLAYEVISGEILLPLAQNLN